MNHKESTIKIFFTKNYSLFKNLKGNRDLNQTKIDRIIDEIENDFDMLRYCPKIVDKDMNIIDGQHRLEVAKELGSNVWYVVCDTISLLQIAKLNTNTERWKPKDFINCYIKQGFQDYKILDDFNKKYRFPRTLSIYLLMYGKLREGGLPHSDQNVFESGQFKAKFINEATMLAEIIMKFKSYSGFRRRSFILSISKLIEAKKCDIDELISKVNKGNSELKECSSVKEFMNGLELIYNRHSRERKVIF